MLAGMVYLDMYGCFGKMQVLSFVWYVWGIWGFRRQYICDGFGILGQNIWED
jgi:hypothetical protein